MSLANTALWFEIKEVNQDGSFSGVASVYGVEDLGGDVIDKGAFTKSIAENGTVPILWQHQSGEVIGEGQLKEWQGKILLAGQLDMEDPTAVKAYNKLKKKLIKGLSIGYTAIKTQWEEIEGKFIRHILELKLWEVSVVTFPMLPDAQVTRVKNSIEDDQIVDALLTSINLVKRSLEGGLRLDSLKSQLVSDVAQQVLTLLSEKAQAGDTSAQHQGTEAVEPGGAVKNRNEADEVTSEQIVESMKRSFQL